MGNLTETATWETNITQLELSTPVLGGPGGPSNDQAQELANRTQKLKEVLEQNGIYVNGTFAYGGQNIIFDALFEASVVDDEVVYWNNVESRFYKALADGSAASKAIGVSDVSNAKVITSGLVPTSLIGTSGDLVYVSSGTAGEATLTKTTVILGVYVKPGIMFISPMTMQSVDGIGDIVIRATSTIPDNHFECNGAELSKSVYPELFAVLGTYYGETDGAGGTGTTHFLLPDYRGYFLRSWNHGESIDTGRAGRTKVTAEGATMINGDYVGTLESYQNKYHRHLIATFNNVATGLNIQSRDSSGASSSSWSNYDGNASDVEARPINTNVLLCIKYQ